MTYMCRILRGVRPSLHDWWVCSMRVSASAARRAGLGVAVRGVFDGFRQVYGCDGAPGGSTSGCRDDPPAGACP